MAKMKQLKKSLIASCLALAVSASTLVGTTFAWFTDSVSSANNIIKSGNLDVSLEYWNGTAWVDVSGKSDILSELCRLYTLFFNAFLVCLNFKKFKKFKCFKNHILWERLNKIQEV